MKKESRMTLRKLLMLMAVISLLLVSLAGCMDDTASDNPSDEPSGTASQTEATDPTDASTSPTEAEETEPPTLMGTVTADNLNVRSNPSTDSTVLKQLDINTRVVIMETKVVGDVTWARLADGWVNMSYILLDGQDPEPTDPVTEPDETTGSESVIATGTITASELNIRDYYGTATNIIGKYKKGDKVEILEVYQDIWARTDKGWISLKYVDLDNDGETPDVGADEDEDKTTSTEIESDGKTKVLGYGVVDIGSLNVRSGPGTKYDKVSSVSGGTRYAYYQKSGNWVRIKEGWVSTGYFYIEGTKDNTASGTVTTDDLNIRTGPGTEYKTSGSYDKGDEVSILHQIDGWGYTGKGWVSMKYVDTGDSTDSGTTATTGTGTITASELNIRKSASKDSDSVGKYEKGDKVTILEVKDGWGKTDKGWISMNYVKMDSTSTEVGSNTTYKTGTATVVVNSSLTIRKSASASSEKVGSYSNGDKVTITKVDGQWGQTDKGWINLKYVKYD